MKILITAGPTREPIDAVRYISNRSSGRVGLALAAAAIEGGHDVTVLLGPGVADQKLRGRCDVYRFGSSAELQQLLDAHFGGCELLIMAAAVSDYRPAAVCGGKLPRQSGQRMRLDLEPTPDLVAQCAAAKRPGQRIIAFALEEADNLEVRAAEKLMRKGIDGIVANPLGTMESDSITAVYLAGDGSRVAPGRMSKTVFAQWLIERITL